MPDDEKKKPEVDVFKMLMEPDKDTFRAPRLELGLLLDTMYSYIRLSQRLRTNPADSLALSSADLMETQLLAACSCLYDAVPSEDRKALRYEALRALMENPDRLPKPPKLEDLD